jgi:DNA-directed RNA polymerase specialized sigma24 family protein
MHEAYAAKQRATLLSAALQSLSSEERIVVMLRSMDRPARAIGEDLNLSHTAILNIEKRGKDKMRAYFTARGIKSIHDLF